MMEKFIKVRSSVENLDYQLTDKEVEREDLDRFELETGYEVGDGYTQEVGLLSRRLPPYSAHNGVKRNTTLCSASHQF